MKKKDGSPNNPFVSLIILKTKFMKRQGFPKFNNDPFINNFVFSKNLKFMSLFFLHWNLVQVNNDTDKRWDCSVKVRVCLRNVIFGVKSMECI